MEFIGAGIGQSLWGTLLLAFVLLGAWSCGRLILHAAGFRAEEFRGAEDFIFSTACGLTVLSLGVLGIGTLGLLNSSALYWLVGSFILLSACFDRPRFVPSFSSPREHRYFPVLLFAFPIALSWVQATAPSIGNDALAYHLYHAKEFVAQHRIFYVPYARESLWPYQTEMFFSMGLALQGTLLAQLFHWLFYPLTALAVYSFADRYHGRSSAQLASLVFLFVPAAFAQSGHAYVDLSFAFFVFLAVYALCLSGSMGDMKAAFLSGLCCGGALSTKYLGLGCFAVLALLWLRASKFRLRTCFCFAGTAAAVSCVWYLRSWWLIGNPVYPFFPHLFHGNGYDFDIGAGVGMGKGPLSFLLFGWNLTLHPNRFGGEMQGPLFLMFLPLYLLYGKRPGKRGQELVFFLVAYTLFLFTQSQQSRFYLSIAPFLSVGVAAVFDALRQSRPFLKRVIYSLLMTVFIIHAGIFCYRTRLSWPVLFGRQSASDYLSAEERSFDGFRYLKENAKAGDTLFNAGEVRNFYSPIKYLRFDCTPLRMDLAKKKMTLEAFLEAERFSYFWLSPDTLPDVRRYVMTHAYKKVYSYDFTEKPTTFHYEIYHLS